MSEAAEYSIATLADMARIPEPARSRMLAELPAILRDLAAVTTWGAIEMMHCVWVDDDKGETVATFVTGPDNTVVGTLEYQLGSLRDDPDHGGES